MLTLFKKNKPLHIFTPPLRKLHGGVKIWRGLFFSACDLFFIHHEKMIYHNFICFADESHYEVAPLGSETIEL